MPRGDNPNSRKNLKVPSSKEARKNGKKGGIASAEARAATKSLSDTLKEALTDEKRQKISEVLIGRALAGNLKAFELIRDSIGEKPKAQVEMSGTLEAQKDKLDSLIDQMRGDD